MLKSSLCRQADIESRDFTDVEKDLNTRRWFEITGIPNPYNIIHRKSWEFSYITLALRERGMLEPGKKGLGFAVGCEPLPSFFASQGCEILATDLNIDSSTAQKWASTMQNAGGDINKLNLLGHCSDEIFKSRVKYHDLDMNDIPEDLNGQFDFCWSSCAIEHVGSLAKSKAFLKNMLNVLKPGGIAVHTTEFNLSSNDKTVTVGGNVLYRERDIIELRDWLLEHGHEIAELDFTQGNMEGDMFVDSYPYYAPPAKYHLKLRQYRKRFLKGLYIFGSRKIMQSDLIKTLARIPLALATGRKRATLLYFFPIPF